MPHDTPKDCQGVPIDGANIRTIDPDIDGLDNPHPSHSLDHDTRWIILLMLDALPEATVSNHPPGVYADGRFYAVLDEYHKEQEEFWQLKPDPDFARDYLNFLYMAIVEKKHAEQLQAELSTGHVFTDLERRLLNQYNPLEGNRHADPESLPGVDSELDSPERE